MEVPEALARDRGIALAPHEHRRNLTTRGVPVGHLVGQYFRVGDCVLYGGRGTCRASTWRPCSARRS